MADLNLSVLVDAARLESCREAYLAFCYNTMGAVPDVNHPLTDSFMVDTALEICREHYDSLLEEKRQVTETEKEPESAPVS